MTVSKLCIFGGEWLGLDRREVRCARTSLLERVADWDSRICVWDVVVRIWKISKYLLEKEGGKRRRGGPSWFIYFVWYLVGSHC